MEGKRHAWVIASFSEFLRVLPVCLLMIGFLAAPSTAETVVQTSSGRVLGTGTSLDPNGTGPAGLQQIVADFDSFAPGFQSHFDEWIQAGGEVAILTGGVAHKYGAKGVSDADTILIRMDDAPNHAQQRARVYHEFLHAWHGYLTGGDGIIDSCAHALVSYFPQVSSAFSSNYA